MSFFNKILLNLLCLITVYCLLATKAFAVDEFYTSYQIIYSVNPDASVSVVQKVSLTNKLADIYATEYELTLGATRIKDIWARDAQGDVISSVETEENNTKIRLKFNEKVVGKDEVFNFSLGYVSNDYGIENGQVLVLGIPKMAPEQNLLGYEVTLKVPAQFKDPIFILPEPAKSINQEGFNIYSFNKKQLLNKSITASFGEAQYFNFNLNYHLENSNNNDGLFEIAIPPDTPFQKLYYQEILPLPENVIVDPDGNWLAQYIVEKGSALDIIATGSAEIFLEPKTEIKEQELDKPSDYLASLKYWRSDGRGIQDLALNLETPRKIYDFVINNLDYNYERATEASERFGAIKALENKNSAVCMEFTDLFIALARSAGIPAREVNGFAYTNNPNLRPLSLEQDILHAWPEYYDKKKKLWVGVDPTWEDTSSIDFFQHLDLNHFAFVFHGLDSEYPYSPGSYRTSDQQGKDVKVSFGKKALKMETVELITDFPDKVLAGKKFVGKIKIKNTGNIAIYNQKLSWQNPRGLKKGKEIIVEVLPPFGFYEKNISFSTSLLKGEKLDLVFYFKDKIQKEQIEIISPVIPYVFPYGVGVILGLIILILCFNIIKRLLKI